MTNTQGEVVWEAEYTTWGNTAKVTYKQTQSTIESEDEVAFQPLRFQGQYYDKETGLHYSRFRYYDPDVGRFTTQDPIGILGSDNFYAYAPNPILWVDPLGLKCANGTHGNSINSTKKQHLYVITRTHNGATEIVKVGISGGRIRLDGKSARAETQVRNWNKNEEGTFRSRIVEKDICGRERALAKERALARKLQAKGLLGRPKSKGYFHVRP